MCLTCSKTTAEIPEAEEATGSVLWKKGLLKISQILQENNCIGMLESLFNKVAGNLKFVKFLRTPISKNVCERALLQRDNMW